MRARFAAVVALLCGILSPFLATARSGDDTDFKVEAQLVWGTNEATSPNPKHKPVEADVARKFKNGPYKWQNYFEERRKRLVVPKGGDISGRMSKHCEIKVKNLGNDHVEVSLYGKGQLVTKCTQSLPKGELLVIGGNADNRTAWFVVLKQVE